ncbi:MAG: J domain-containing protein [Halobacteriaceae archaeon]
MSPLWQGLAITAGLSVVFAAVFVVAERRYPTPPAPEGESDAGEQKRRAEIRAYLDAIGERYAEEHFVAGQHVAFYLPGRDVAITFDARAYFRIAATETHPILVEHEMPGAHLGARLPFETPEMGAASDPDGPEPSDPNGAFAVLGLSADASLEEVRTAYREKVKEVHPDQGGDERAFRRVRQAYTTARQQAT